MLANDSANTARNSIAYINDRVYTVNKTQPWAEAFIVDPNRKFSTVGKTSLVAAAAKAASMVTYDLKGRTLIAVSSIKIIRILLSSSWAWAATICSPTLLPFNAGYNVEQGEEDPVGGKHELRQDGSLTGELKDQAGNRLMATLPKPAAAHVKRVVQRAIVEMHRHGVTSCQDASSTEMLLSALSELEAENNLKMQFAAHCLYKNEWLTGEIQVPADKLILNADKYRSRHVDTRFVKMMMGGACTPALMSHSDVDDNGIPDQSKILLPDAAELVKRFDGRGMTCKIHCMGYGGARTALDAFEIVRQMRPDGPRHEVAHCTQVLPEDCKRFKQLNVTADMSPAGMFDTSQSENLRLFQHDFERITAAGAHVTIGSDWAHGLELPMFHNTAILVRRIGAEKVLEMITLAGAVATGREKEAGSIEVGKIANFICVDRDVTREDFENANVLRTCNKTSIASQETEARWSNICKPSASDEDEVTNSLACLTSPASSLHDMPPPDQECSSGAEENLEATISLDGQADELATQPDLTDTVTESSPPILCSLSTAPLEIFQEPRYSFLWSYFVIRATKVFLCWDTGETGLNELTNDPYTAALTAVAANSRPLRLAGIALSALLYSRDYPGFFAAGQIAWLRRQSFSALEKAISRQEEKPLGIIFTAIIIHLGDMDDDTGALEVAFKTALDCLQQDSHNQTDSAHFDVARHLLRWSYICKQLSFVQRMEAADEDQWTKLEFRDQELQTTLCRQFSTWAIHPLYTVSHRWINPLMRLGRLVQLRSKAENASLGPDFDKQVDNLEGDILTAREKDLFVFMKGTSDLPDLVRLNEAMYSAVVLVFYTRLRDLAWTSLFARQQVLNVCEHVEAIGKYSRTLNNIVFPVFLTGCEAVDLGLRARITRLLSSLHPAGFWFHQEAKLLANLQHVWTIRDDMPGALWPEWSKIGQCYP
ncbi:hypothetical protein FOVSG1_006414 [Fusarium oxysporum f. sp. vasinfectum]